MKKLFLALVFVALLVNPRSVFAQTPVNKLGSPAGTLKEKNLDQNQEKRIANAKERANKEIDRRINSLNEVGARISLLKRLSDSQKSSLLESINAQINSLTELRAKIDADSDVATLKADIQSVVTAYRIYLLYIPKIHILSAVDAALDTADKLSEVSSKLQAKVLEAQNKGQTVSGIQTFLADINSKIANAKTLAQNAQNTVLPLTPEGYPGNKTQLESARSLIKNSNKDLQTAARQTKGVIQALKTYKISTSSASPLATP